MGLVNLVDLASPEVRVLEVLPVSQDLLEGLARKASRVRLGSLALKGLEVLQDLQAPTERRDLPEVQDKEDLQVSYWLKGRART